jgi:quinoprotein glucose dehydrogenase
VANDSADQDGHLFILDRDTGQPVFPVEERPVPQGGVAGEWLSPTQPFPVATPRLVPDRLEPQDAWGLTRWDRAGCRETIAGLRRGGIFTPPSLQGTLQYPGNAGGTNWGGVAKYAAGARRSGRSHRGGPGGHSRRGAPAGASPWTRR